MCANKCWNSILNLKTSINIEAITVRKWLRNHDIFRTIFGKGLTVSSPFTTTCVKKQFHSKLFLVISLSKMQAGNVLKNLKVNVYTSNEDTCITC